MFRLLQCGNSLRCRSPEIQLTFTVLVVEAWIRLLSSSSLRPHRKCPHPLCFLWTCTWRLLFSIRRDCPFHSVIFPWRPFLSFSLRSDTLQCRVQQALRLADPASLPHLVLKEERAIESVAAKCPSQSSEGQSIDYGFLFLDISEKEISWESILCTENPGFLKFYWHGSCQIGSRQTVENERECMNDLTLRF